MEVHISTAPDDRTILRLLSVADGTLCNIRIFLHCQKMYILATSAASGMRRVENAGDIIRFSQNFGPDSGTLNEHNEGHNQVNLWHRMILLICQVTYCMGAFCWFY